MASVIANLNNRVEDLIKEQLNGLLSDEDLSQLVKEKVDLYLENEIPERIRVLSTRFFASKKDAWHNDELDCYFELALRKMLKEKTDSFMHAIQTDPRWVVSVDEKGYPIIGEFLKEILAMDPNIIPDVITLKNSISLAKSMVYTISMAVSATAYNNNSGQYDPTMMSLSNNLLSVVKDLENKFLGANKPMPLISSEKPNDESTTSV